ncbi:flagellar hook-basal body complex protein FliE [Cochlodiniinecator piscidefendens]|uniref:flagellar hook-basal body complex protein FliE n=1 Tax=Cochlodiniinecator piscidefendens TaxID=2715756 RepID=UPI00140984C8|nr:flagellar hook-basal body complex protein FliE [Cochlodiniinecator piscidefendens]
MDIRSSMAAQNYAATRPLTAPDPEAEGSNVLGQAASEFAQVLQQGEETAMATMAGQADPAALVQALAQTELAVEVAVTVRDKVVEAYQEILRMPV